MICEQASRRVMLMDAEMDWSDPDAVRWAWSPADDPGLSDQHRGWFNNPSEAKPVRSGTQVLVTASGGGVALIDFATARAVWYARAGNNPHSAELLPDGRIVTASSSGNEIALFDPEAGTEALDRHTLADAHDVEWDARRQCLWAVGGKQMIQFAYVLNSDAPRLTIKETFDQPITEASRKHERHGGHDLTLIPGDDSYLFTDMDNLWVFDPDDLSFTPLPQRHDMILIKSISQHNDGTIIVLQAPALQQWWAEGPVTLDETRKWELPGARIYKARWWRE